MPVVAPDHPLAQLGRPVSHADLEQHVQLVLSDPLDPDGPSYGVVGARLWRFVDLARRIDFLLAGLGWCRMPVPFVSSFLAEGRLQRVEVVEDNARLSGPLTIYAAHMRDRPLGRAGKCLLDHLASRLASQRGSPARKGVLEG